MKPAARDVRVVALAEAVSYLLLLGVAMPLKYAAGIPQAVMVSGWIHGLLFMVLIVLLTRARVVGALSTVHGAVILLASLVPIVPFLLDSRVRAWGR